MAEVTLDPGSDPSDSGQMILVTGVVLAVVFVALALLVNTAIYTDNVATRDSDAAGEAIEYRADAVGALAGLLEAENAAGDSVTAIRDNLTGGTDRIDAALAETSAGRSAAAELAVDIDAENATEGRSIKTDGTAEFESWEANATGVRGFVIDVGGMAEGESFEVILDDTRLKVNGTADGVAVETGGDVVCETDADPARFDVTGRLLGGDPCSYGPATLGDGGTVGVANTDNVTADYELTVESTDDDAIPAGLETTEAVYALENVTLRYRTPALRYEETVRIAPGEFDA